MKITDVTLTLFWQENVVRPSIAGIAQGPTRTQLGLVTITTDEGLTGHGFVGTAYLGADRDGHLIVSELKPLLMGQNPLDREKIWQALMRQSPWMSLRTISAVDIALWDLAGKITGLPVHQLLGTYREKIPAYVSSSQLSGGVEAYKEHALHYRDVGYTAYKIHPPVDVKECIAVCEGVRDALGPDYCIMIDTAWAYDYPQALYIGQAIEELGFYWYEDPLATDDIYNYVKLKEKLRVPILATERLAGSLTEYAPWILAKATDYLRGDVTIRGGITSVMKGAHLAEAFHMNYEVHHAGNSLGNIANLHVLMAIKNCEYYEVFMPQGSLQYGIIDDTQVDSEGFVRPPVGPGLGANIDFDLIKRNTVTVLG